MPQLRRIRLVPGAAPSRVLKFLRRNPDARPLEMALKLGLKRSTVEMAITRLVQMKLHERPPRSPPEPSPKQPALSPTASLRLARAQFSAAAGVGPSLQPDSQPEVHPTGTPFVVIDGVMHARGGVQAFGISGPQASAPEAPRHGTSNVPGETHPWAWGNSRSKPGG